MSWDTGLADRIRAKGVRVVEVDGWQTRGSTSYAPQLALWHHTAGAARGATPSLAVCIYGRTGLRGPLCQVLQSRDPNGDDIAYVIAAGKANHGGTGNWRGVSGNSKAFGLEVEHVGTSTQPGRRHEITARILAAGLEGPGGSRDARNCCRHAEYATPAGRKIDFNVAASPWTASDMRSRVGYWIGRTATTEEDDMPGIEKEWLERKLNVVIDKVEQVYNKGNAQTGLLYNEIRALRGGKPLTVEDVQRAVNNVLVVHEAVEDSALRDTIAAELAEYFAGGDEPVA